VWRGQSSLTRTEAGVVRAWGSPMHGGERSLPAREGVELGGVETERVELVGARRHGEGEGRRRVETGLGRQHKGG
jgi:hypothetical protein